MSPEERGQVSRARKGPGLPTSWSSSLTRLFLELCNPRPKLLEPEVLSLNLVLPRCDLGLAGAPRALGRAEPALLLFHLVQEQRRQLVVLHRLRISVAVTDDEVGQDLVDFLGDQSVLQPLLIVVPEGHRPQPRERFAVVRHVPNALFVARR